METTTRLVLPEIIEALQNNPEDVRELLEELHPADLADLIRELNPEQAQSLLAMMPVELSARLFEQIDDGHRVTFFVPFAKNDQPKAVAILDEMAPDDRADMVANLDQALRQALLANMSEAGSRDVRKLLAYSEGTAGALLTTDFVTLAASNTAQDSIDQIRRQAEELETIYQAYAVDSHGTLLGAVSLRDLVTSPSKRSIDEIMEPNIVTVPIDSDQEDVARIIAKYDLLAVPVVDGVHRIIGIITVDDVMDVVEEEATEDVQKLGAVEPLDASYIRTPIWDLFRARAPWLIILFFAVMATRNVLEFYSDSGESVKMLFWFVPLIASSGGNSGTQSATLVIRALALGKVDLSQTLKVLSRELAVGISLGLVLGLLGIIAVMAFDSTRILGLALTIALSLLLVVTVGALIGSSVPLLLERFNIDPAVASTPFIASLVDIAGLVIYFEIAKIFLV